MLGLEPGGHDTFDGTFLVRAAGRSDRKLTSGVVDMEAIDPGRTRLALAARVDPETELIAYFPDRSPLTDHT